MRPPERRASFGFLKEASPLAAFRRKRTCFEKSTSFGKHHLWRLSEGSELVLKKARPSESITSGGFPKEANLFPSFGKLHLWRLDERPSGSFTSGGFLKEARLPSATFGFLRQASPLAGRSPFLKEAQEDGGYKCTTFELNDVPFGITHPVYAPHTHTTSAEPHLKEANTLYTHTTYANTLYSDVFFQRTSLLRKRSLLDVKYAVLSGSNTGTVFYKHEVGACFGKINCGQPAGVT